MVVPSARVAVSTRAVRSGNANAPASVPATDPADAGVAVVAPLTGVFYSSSSPTADPFVNVGDMVQAGQVVCIVEAMKVFNEIKSDVSGIVTSIPRKNGQLVQRGEPLVRVKPF